MVVKINSKSRLLKIWFPIISIILLLGVVAFVFYYPNNPDGKLLLPIRLRNLKVGGHRIDVLGTSISEDGKILDPVRNKISYNRILPYVNFYILTKTDPLFSSENVDAKSLDASVKNLKSTQNQLVVATGYKQNIVPVDFLDTLPDVTVKTKKYLADPTVENGRSLVNSYELSEKNYESSISDLIHSVGAVFPDGEAQKLNYLNVETTDKVIVSDLKLAQKNAQALKVEIGKRSQLIEGRNAITTFAESTPAAEYKTYVEPKFLSVGDQLGVNSSYLSSLQGPYIAKTSCFDGADQEKYFYVYDMKLFGKTVFMPKLADQNYYLSIDNSQEQYTDYKKAGVSYELMSEGNSYRCNDLTYEADLLTVENFQKRFGGEPLSDEITQKTSDLQLNTSEKETIKALQEFETRYFADKYKSSENLQTLGSLYLKSYQVLALNEAVPDSLLNSILQRYATIHDKLANSNKVFDTTFFLNFILKSSSPDILKKQVGDKLLATRSAYSFSLLNFTPSVWRISTQPKYFDGNYNLSSKVLTYDKLIGQIGGDKIRTINSLFSVSQKSSQY